MSGDRDRDRDNFYNRLSRTETYASKRLKQKKEKPKDTDKGRPLYNIEIEPYDSLNGHDNGHDKAVGGIQHVRSSSTFNTVSTSLSSSSSFSSSSSSSSTRKRFSQSRSRCNGSGSTTGSGVARRQSVFDRLANTGTKSSLRKHKKSATYVGEEDTLGESIKKQYSQGNKNIRDMLTQPMDGDKRFGQGGVHQNVISFFPNQQEAEI